MSSIKLDMEIHEAGNKLERLFRHPINKLSSIEMGELSRVFKFSTDNRSYVVHFRKDRESFDKAEYMYKTYASILPIPEVVQIGVIDGLYYSISKLIEGRPVNQFSNKEQQVIIVDIIRNFNNMTEIKLNPSCGYGRISSVGKGLNSSWSDFLLAFYQEDKDGFYKNWTNLFTEGMLEKSLWDEGKAALFSLLKYLPDKPFLVHGDFHLGNMLSDGKIITGIVDWEFATYGDFMFDLATMRFWHPEIKFPDRIRNKWKESGKNIPNYEERMIFFMIYKAVEDLRFFARKEDRDGYQYCRKQLYDCLRKL